YLLCTDHHVGQWSRAERKKENRLHNYLGINGNNGKDPSTFLTADGKQQFRCEKSQAKY
ncbi:Unknown protein, partial [Striga hermonthica]